MGGIVFPFSKVKKEISTHFHSTHNPIVFYASLKFRYAVSSAGVDAKHQARERNRADSERATGCHLDRPVRAQEAALQTELIHNLRARSVPHLGTLGEDHFRVLDRRLELGQRSSWNFDTSWKSFRFHSCSNTMYKKFYGFTRVLVG